MNDEKLDSKYNLLKYKIKKSGLPDKVLQSMYDDVVYLEMRELTPRNYTRIASKEKGIWAWWDRYKELQFLRHELKCIKLTRARENASE